MLTRYRWISVLSIFYSVAISAQNNHYNFSRVDVENGLSNNQVYSICRDSTGFLWFGTASGLNRYDGYSCKVFVNVPGDSTSLEDNYVSQIFPFPGNKLLIASKDSISIYDPRTEKFDRNFQRYLSELSLPQKKLLFSLQDKNGDYWYLFEKEGLYKYSPTKHMTIRFNFRADELNGRQVVNITADANNLWLVYDNGYLIQVEPGSLTTLKTSFALSDIFKGKTLDYRIFADRQGKVWAYTNGTPTGVFKFNPVNNSISRFNTNNTAFRLNDNMIKGIGQDKNGSIWIGTDHGGVNVVDEMDNSKIVYLVNKEHDKTSIGYNSVETIYEDHKGLIWVGTGKKGVSYLNQNIVQFDVYKHEADNKNSLPFNDVNYFVEDRKGNAWIGTNGGGLLYFERAKQKFTQYVNNPSNPNSLSNNVIVSLCLDHEDKLWIGTYLGGLDVFDGKTFTHYRHNPDDPFSIADDRIWHIMEDRNHVMWIGTLQGGLNRFDRKAKRFYRYYVDSNAIAKPIHSNYIPVIREDSKGYLWVGTSEGIEVINKERTKFTYYKHTNDPSSLSHQNILDIIEDRKGRIWIGTRIGLNVFDYKTKKFKTFTTNDGLPDNAILSIAEDKESNLWITTPKGLCRLVAKETNNSLVLEVRNFKECNNVQGNVFNEGASMVTADGLLYVGGSTGFNIIDPGKVIPRQNKPGLVFTNIDIFNNEIAIGESINKNVVLRKALPFVDEIELRNTENIFSIEFTALDFSRNNQYAYKLEGFNKNWMYTNSGNRKVTYTNLDPGTYYFKVKATNSDGVWSDEEKTLKIIIKPPFWKTPFAVALYILSIAGVLYLARRYTLEKAHMRFEVKQQKKESERIQALDALKTKFFTNVSHEFRTPLSLILAPLDRMIKNSADPDHKKQVQLVQRNAKRLLNLVNQLLDFRKMEVQQFKLQPTEGDIIRFIKDITCSFSDISEMKNITLSFTANVESLVTYFDKDKLEKILFNLLSNAFKYTPSKGVVEVHALYLSGPEAAEEIKIIVKDSGIGIAVEDQVKIFERYFQNDVPANISNPGTGIGLAITKEFVKLHNGKVDVRSEPEKGTSFIITLPLHRLKGQFVPVQEIHELLGSKGDAQQATINQGPVKKNRPVVLLVEDNDDFRFYLKDNLKQEYEVYETVNGQEAWELLEKIKPDVVVSDVMMPYMDGIELTKRIKKSNLLMHIPVILLTAVGDEEMQLESYKLGVSDFMLKPFTFELLAFKLKNILSQAAQKAKNPSKIVEVNPTEIEIQPADEVFLKRVLEVIEKNMAVPEFTVEELSRELFMHRAGMYRKLLSLTGLTPLEFIRDIRLKRARQLLEKSQMTVSEVAYEVGFNNPKKFSQHFKEHFNITPSQFQKQATQKI